MKQLKPKHLLQAGLGIFLLYLCIHYWPVISGLLGTVLSAAFPLLLGCVIAYPLNILMSFYERHYFPRSGSRAVLRSRRPVCLVLALLTLLLILALVIALVLPQLVSCVELLIAEVPDAMRTAIAWLEEVGVLPEDLSATLASIDWKSRLTQILSVVTSGIGSVVDIAIKAVSSVVSGVASAVVAIIFAIYVLAGKDRLSRQATRLMQRYMKEKHYRKTVYTLSVLNDSFHRFIVGQCTEAVILGLLCMLGMWLLKLPYAPMIGALIAFTALIPVVGAFVGAGIGAFLILMQSPFKALVFLIFIVVLQQFEGNVIYPRVVGSSIGLPGIWVLAAVTVGGGVFGIWGMLIAVPLAAAVYRLLRNDVQKNDPPPEAEPSV
ncbi:MAG: AI-2E family transporter [Oscillospiraceae bacterium]|nr:AI-2E family transporter [Oscillospiraceae bacterium]